LLYFNYLEELNPFFLGLSILYSPSPFLAFLSPPALIFISTTFCVV
jgi:hypothetical protein